MLSLRSLFLPAAVALAVSGATAHAQQLQTVGGGLEVFPTRVVFEGRTRAAELNLQNHGTETATYRIVFEELQMTDTGELREVPAQANAASSAAPMVRYSPRQVTLRPGEVQSVRLMVRKPEKLPAGEYRSHLLFQAIPSTRDKGGAAQGQDVSVKLTAVFGVAIPVIIREGEVHAETRISAVSLQPSPGGAHASVGFQLHRTGSASAYGDLQVSWVAPNGAEEALGTARGVAVYVPNALRKIRIPVVAAHAPRGGKLRVRYTAPSGATLAEVEQPLG